MPGCKRDRGSILRRIQADGQRCSRLSPSVGRGHQGSSWPFGFGATTTRPHWRHIRCWPLGEPVRVRSPHQRQTSFGSGVSFVRGMVGALYVSRYSMGHRAGPDAARSSGFRRLLYRVMQEPGQRAGTLTEQSPPHRQEHRTEHPREHGSGDGGLNPPGGLGNRMYPSG